MIKNIHEESDNTEAAVADALSYEEVHGEVPDWQTLMILQEEKRRIDSFSNRQMGVAQ